MSVKVLDHVPGPPAPIPQPEVNTVCPAGLSQNGAALLPVLDDEIRRWQIGGGVGGGGWLRPQIEAGRPEDGGVSPRHQFHITGDSAKDIVRLPSRRGPRGNLLPAPYCAAIL